MESSLKERRERKPRSWAVLALFSAALSTRWVFD